MRPLKFRARRNQTWVCIDLTESAGFARDLLQMLATGEATFTFDTPLEQFTGLTDKNRKEIYEGDILKRPDWESISVVEWYQPMCAFMRNLHDGLVRPALADAEFFEVIGNIHENPELLK
jgi:uncharacterized phage protein (TIGR01671 family)